MLSNVSYSSLEQVRHDLPRGESKALFAEPSFGAEGSLELGIDLAVELTLLSLLVGALSLSVLISTDFDLFLLKLNLFLIALIIERGSFDRDLLASNQFK